MNIIGPKVEKKAIKILSYERFLEVNRENFNSFENYMAASQEMEFRDKIT